MKKTKNREIKRWLRIKRQNVYRYRVRSTMVEKLLNIDKLTALTGAKRTTVNGWVRGTVPMTWDGCVKLADALGITTDYMFGEDFFEGKETFAEMLEKELKKRKWLKKDFAKMVGVCDQTVSEWTSGSVPRSDEQLAKIGEVLGRSVEELEEYFVVKL